MQDMFERTKKFSVRIVRLYTALPKTTEAQVMGKQLLRSGTSMGAHYYEAMHSRSNAELIAKIDLGLQELRETNYWLELLIETGIVKKERVFLLANELNELISIFVTISKNVKAKSC